MKRLIILFLSLSLLYCIERFCHEKTDGFAIENIASGAKVKSQASLPPFLEPLLNQPFFYLDSGAQSYVFISQDQEFVLKFFKNQHLRIPPWIDALPLFGPLGKYQRAKREKKSAIKQQLIESIDIADKYLKEETGLIYTHLQKTQGLNKKLTIYDKINICHKLDLDQYEFYIQKKAELAYSYLAKTRDSKVLYKLLKLIKSRYEKNIFDKDPDFATNFGFIYDTPIQIDLGRFSIMAPPLSSLFLKEEMIRITRPFKKWLEKESHPFYKEIDATIEDLYAPNQ
ncbi:MAG: hypothetical protein WDZ28_05450 [Simkaniaceae bacterium]